MRLRSIELTLPRAREAADFLADIWKLARAEQRQEAHYLRGSGTDPYLVALDEGAEPVVRSVTFACSQDEMDNIATRARSYGSTVSPVVSSDPGGGRGIIVELAEGELFRFLEGGETVTPIDDADLPVQLTHVVLNAPNAEAAARHAEDVLGFQVSDRTKGMIFVRCNRSHHSIAFARAGFASLNHIAFEMLDMDAVFRGVGRLRDHGMAPAWGPGRHGPGNNVFAYFVAPFGAVVEFSTAVETIADTYRVGTPEDWAWPPGRIDRWGLSDKDLDQLGRAERTFRFPGVGNQ